MAKFEVTMKPVALPKNYGRNKPEYLLTLEASDRMRAAVIARAEAEADGFRGYAVTAVKEVRT